jgi:single-strand DNA-binding protein
MRSFRLFAVGRLGRDPELVNTGKNTYTRFCLLGNDYGGKDDQGEAREIVTSVWFTLWGSAAEALAHECQIGDQVIVEGHLIANNFVDDEGNKRYTYNFIAQSFRRGAPGRATRESLSAN